MQKPTPVDSEYTFEGKKIVSETDSRGFITYANRKFCEISGYTAQELIGQNHNIIRHPDMPQAAFKQMWKDLKAAKEWHGYVKNLRKDGQYYWVETHITPRIDAQHSILGYIAVRSEVNRQNLPAIIAEYDAMREEELSKKGH